MRHFAANYIFDGQALIKNSFISVDKDNKITYIGKENEGLIERPFMIFENGILCPGFVNTHCHLELSDFIKTDEKHKGLTYFIKSIISKRDNKTSLEEIEKADRLLFEQGINLIGDISNTDKTITTKRKSKIHYHNFIEISGVISRKSDDIIANAKRLSQKYNEANLENSIVPHSLYSISKEILLFFQNPNNKNLLSIHFLESEEELSYFNGEKNNLHDFIKSIDKRALALGDTILDYYNIIQGLSKKQRVLSVHNTQINNKLTKYSDNIYYSLCPSSNLYLHNALPDKDFVLDKLAHITIGTDSFASIERYDIFNELKLLSENYPEIKIENLLKIICSNGGKALNKDGYGNFKLGKNYGVNLISNLDLENLKIKKDTFAERII